LPDFKSYKGHHILTFGDSYFTSIIGPNGSGKSNSYALPHFTNRSVTDTFRMDAISFVLGIKSSHLRSTQLRDLVYRGRVYRTSKINADGTATEETAETNGHVNGDAHSDEEGTRRSSQRDDAKTAWVMAVYEDDAGDEQKWKRTITSSGTSEYRINNRVVSAKQYNEVLEIENILVKARNFLVFQGDVEAIAQQSPRDLTRLIEQISGSLEYKEDYDRLKIESEKANEEQTFKLNQRRAMNSEIRQYQEQKREAENFERKASERDSAIVTHVLWKLFHFQRVMEESTAEIEQHKAQLQEYERSVEKYKQRLDDAQREQAKASREVAKMNRAIEKKQKDIEENENSLVPIDEKITLSKMNVGKYRVRVGEVSKERDSQQRTVDQFTKDLKTVEKAQKRWEEEQDRAAQQSGRQLSSSDLQEYSRLRGEVTKRTAADQSQADGLARQLKSDEETVTSLKNKIESTTSDVQKLEDELQSLIDRRKEFETQAKQYQNEIDAKKKEINALASERSRTTQVRVEMDEKLRDVLNKLVEADSGRRESEKETRARETVAAMKRIFPGGVLGRVHELCKPKQKKFETAIAIALGRHWDSVVVDTEKTAKDCIQYLRDQRAGQATFIPLDTIQVKPVNSNLKGAFKGMRLAIDAIDYDTEVERAMSYACGNAMVCDSLAVAKHIIYEKGIEATAVTLDGMKIHKGGLMTGGRGPNDKPRRWDDAEVENLRRLAEKYRSELAALDSSKNQRHGREEEEKLQGELAALEQRVLFAREEVKALIRNHESKQKEHAHKKSQLNDAKPRYQQQSKDLDTLKTNIKRFQDSIASVEDDVFASFCQRLGYSDIREYEAQQGTLQQELLKKKLEFSTQRSRLENQLRFEEQRLLATNDRIKKLEDHAKRDENGIERLEAEREAIQEELDNLQAELEALDMDLKTLQDKAAEKSSKVAEERRELQKRTKTVEDQLKAVAELEGTVQRNAAERFALLRKCRIDEIKIPLASRSRPLTDLPLNEVAENGDGDAMDVDGADGLHIPEIGDYGIEVDFEPLDDDLKEVSKPFNLTPLTVDLALYSNNDFRMTPLAPKKNFLRK